MKNDGGKCERIELDDLSVVVSASKTETILLFAYERNNLSEIAIVDKMVKKTNF